ncbi:hypothetical protein FB645_003692 [Coemansia sp. IMI 203386]|nr:hypothetical protein FB645_003692 [Coemansia sp. IMI 203386]
MANNIAVIEFNKSIEDTYISIVAFGRSDDMKDVYFRRGYDQEAGDWATPQFYVTSKDAKDCAFYSALYRANNEWMTCISQTAKSVIDNNCIVPFGVDYRLRGNKASLNAIYSHSIIEGNDKCSNKSTRFDYYTRLEPYLGFASKVLNRTLRYSSITGKYSKSTNFTDSMSDPSNPLPEGFTMISGNIYESDSVVRTVGGMHSDLPPLVSTSTKGIVSSTSIQSISTSINLTSDINDKLSTPVNDDTPSNDNITDQSTNYNERRYEI